MVTGTPAAELAELLDLAADSESVAAASTWRFSPASVRRALDAGHDAGRLLAELAAVAIGGLPQPLAYLIGDVARRHGAVRGHEATCCLRSDDPALLAEIAADRRLRGLGLRALAPTVLAGTCPLADTLAALRKAGYAPVAEAADGTPVLEREPRRRTSGEPVSPRPGRRAAEPPRRRARQAARPDPQALARTLLAKPDEVAPVMSETMRTIRASASLLPDSQARVLAHAVETGGAVTLDYLNAEGAFSRREIEEIVLAGNTVIAWCRLREDERVFALARMLSVTPST